MKIIGRNRYKNKNCKFSKETIENLYSLICNHPQVVNSPLQMTFLITKTIQHMNL